MDGVVFCENPPKFSARAVLRQNALISATFYGILYVYLYIFSKGLIGMTKKLLSIVLALVMTFGCVSVAANAVNGFVPTIVVPGVFQSETFVYDENGNVMTDSSGNPLEGPFFLPATGDIVKDALQTALVPLANMLATQDEKDTAAAEAVADVLSRTLMGKNQCDEYGHFIYDVRATKYYASFDKLSEHDQGWILDNLPLNVALDIAGGENLYVFSYASLGNMIDTARELYDFIQFVKADSGADKVNLAPVSQGGSITNALMQIYNEEGRSMAEDLNRMVFVIPALDGTLILGDIYANGFLDDSYEVYNTMLPALIGEDNPVSYLVNLILHIMPEADVNQILDSAVDKLLNDSLGYSTLMWGLVPSGSYPIARAKYLLDDSKTHILEQTDWFYQAQLDSDANILKAVDDGVKVFDIVDYNVPLYELCDSYDDVQADGIIHTDSTSMGAFSLGVDKELPADYKSAVNNCHNPKHNHKDPHNIMDPCTGLLPDTTFYFYNQSHAATGSNDVLMKLASELLTDENFTDVFTYPDRFPQFNGGRNGRRLLNTLNALKALDQSKMDEATKKDVNDAIAQGQAVYDSTVVHQEEVEAAMAHMEEAKAKAENGGTLPEEKEESNFFTLILKFLSSLYYWLWGGKGIGEVIGWPEIYGEIQAKDAITQTVTP